MTAIRHACLKTIEPFLMSYGDLCNDLQLNRSKQLYELVADRLLATLPEKSTRVPYKLTDNMIQKIQEDILKSSDKTTSDSAALALNRMIVLCKQRGILEGRVMISKRVRPEEISIHDKLAFALLDDFIVVREWLCKRIKKVPRSKYELPQLAIASLIAVNGICSPNAHLRITSSRKTHLKKSDNYSTLDVPKSHFCSSKPPYIRYPILPEILALLEYLKGDNDWLFPSGFNPDSWGKKKQRTARINKWLAKLWTVIFGRESDVPKTWTIRNFITCSRLFYALEGSPIVAAYLSGKATFASIDVESANEDLAVSCPGNINVSTNASTSTNDNIELLLVRDLIKAIQGHLGTYHHKLQSKKAKKSAAFQLLGISAVYRDLLDSFTGVKYLIYWMVSELEQDGNRRKMGTLRSFWTFIPIDLLEELNGISPLDLDENQWARLAEYIIQENSYSSATRSKIKQHLKAFHRYLCDQHGLQEIDWRRGELKVYTDQSEGIFPLLSEFDLLFNEAGKHPDPLLKNQLQASLTLAFFGGLRAEEICLVSKMDIDKITMQVRIWWSKTRQGRRRLPLYLLTPKKYMQPVMNLHGVCKINHGLLFQNKNSEQISPDALGKRVKKLIDSVLPSDRAMSIHTLRHGFASWLLIRYFALHEPELLLATHSNGAPIIPDAGHDVFSMTEQKKLVRVFNGRVAGEQFANNPGFFISKPEHFAYISKLIGHATRDTTARTYIHSMDWIAQYYISRKMLV